jgi:hypothetical protein
MSATRATITIDPETFDRAERTLADLDARVSPEGMVETFGVMSEALSDFYEHNWPPPGATNLDPQSDTLDRWPDEQVLQHDGRLHQALSAKAVGSGAIRTITPASLRWGTSLRYARYVNFGTDHMAGRHFFGLSPEIRAMLDDVLAERIGIAGLLSLS